MNKVLLFDLDGTLLRSDKTISPRTLLALRTAREKGCLIGVSTSRGEQICKPFLNTLEPDLLIASGGASVKCGQTYIKRDEFSSREVRKMIAASRTVCGEDVEITVDTLDTHYWNYKIDPRTQDSSFDSVFHDYHDFDQKALRICVEVSDEACISQLLASFPPCDAIRFSDGNWYKFTKKGATKENAILEICHALHITPKDITAFGDDYADIGMLRLCGKGIAMGNAIAEVKAIADAIIGTNDEDGIADYLETAL